MKKLYFAILLLYCLPLTLKAQSPSISINYLDYACLGAVQKIQFSLTGELKADNKFTVQVRKTDNTPVVAELPAVLRDGKLEVSHLDSSLTANYYIQLRVVASSPRTESNWYSFRLLSKGTISLGSVNSDTINAGDDLQIRFTAISSSDVRVTLNDSSKFYLYGSSQSEFISYNNLTIDKTDNFYIAHAENSCGAMKVSGQVKAVVNTVSLKTTSIAPYNVCEDSEVKISMSVQGGPFPASTKFRVRFTEAVSSNSVAPRTAEVAAVLQGNILTARFPKSFQLKYQTQFKAKILADNPKTVGSAGEVTINVTPYPAAEFYTQSSSITVGQDFYLGVQFTGLAPFSADLGNGVTINSNYSGQANTYVSPTSTTSYSIKSFSSGCGQITIPAPQTVVVTVKEGIFLGAESSRQILCVGTKARLPIKTNGSFNAGTTYQVNGIFQNNAKYTFPATRVGDFLEISIPVLDNFSFDQLNSFQVVTSNPAATSQFSYSYAIQSKPSLTLATGNTLSYDSPGNKSLYYNVKGDGPATIEDQDGRITSNWGTSYYQNFYLSKTTDFKLKSISNACFKNDDMPTTRVTMTGSSATANIYLTPIKASYCAGDSIEISFSTTGKFGDDNVFNVQGYSECCTYQNLKSTKTPGTFRIKIPTSQYNSNYFSVRIASTNPVLFTDALSTNLQTLPSQLQINPQGTALQPAQYLKSNIPDLYFYSSSSGLTSVVYSDGTTDNTVNFNSSTGSTSTKISPPVGKTTVYTLKSATNLCGTQSANVSTYIKVIPYAITLTDYYSARFCAGSPLIVPFGISNGDPGNATFSLEIAKSGNYDFSPLVTAVTGRQFSTTIPADMAAGGYQIRVTSSDGSVSNISSFQIGAAPTAKISTTLPEPISINPNDYLPLKIDFTGSAPWTVVFDDNSKLVSYSNPDYQSRYLTSSRDFSLKSVSNSCGFGTTSGKVSVKIKPVLTLASSTYSVCEGGSFPVTYNLTGEADLSSDYIKFQLVDNVSQKTITLDSTRNKSGTITLKLPSVLGGSYYQIRGVVRSYAINSYLNVGVTVKADVTIKGNTTINSGETTRIILQNNKANSEAKYVLSNGLSGTLSGSSAGYEYYLTVSPTQTTIYTLTAVSNSCGDGKKSGSARVEVNAPSERSVTVTGVAAYSLWTVCTGDTVNISYSQKGSFSAGNVMTVQISDSTGSNYKSITTLGNVSPVKAIIPTDLFAGKKFRLRIIASDAGTASGSFEYPLTAGFKAKAKFASESVLYNGVNNPKIVVLLEGGSPWQYQYGSDVGGLLYRTSYNASDTITLYQASPNQYYKLFRVSNQCGVGTIGTPATVRVEVITGEPAILAKVIIAPNPVQDNLLIRFDSSLPRKISLYNLQGNALRDWNTRKQEETVDIRQLSSGMYILKIDSQGKTVTYKIIKQ